MAAKTTTGDLVEYVAHQAPGLYDGDIDSKAAAKRVVEAVLERIGTSLQLGRDVHLSGLGTLSVQERRSPDKAFGKPNPSAGRILRQVTFRDSVQLRRRLNEDPT